METLVRAVTVALSGVDPHTAPVGLYLLVGPTGTGKTHLARSLCRLLHGNLRHVVVADCLLLGGHQDWQELVRQVAPRFAADTRIDGESAAALPPMSILLVEHLEAAKPEVVQALVSSVLTGGILLPDGKLGSLAGCLVLLTTNLCAHEIADSARKSIGFSPSSDPAFESERARIYELCCAAAERRWGPEVLARLDDIIVFHPLLDTHLPAILREMIVGLKHQLASRGVRCEIDPQVESRLLARASGLLRQGAWPISRIFRRFLLFPVADLLHDGRLGGGATLHVTADSRERLCFRVSSSATIGSDARSASPSAIPVG